MTLIDLVRARALDDPTRLAIDDGATRLVRHEFLSAAMRLACEIVWHVPVGAPVGIFLENDALAPVAVLACAAAGCPHVALDVRYPTARNREIARRTGLAAIVERPERSFAVDASDAAVPRLSIELDVREGHRTWADAPRQLGLDDPFVILFTSGSTGTPKGVVHSQCSLLQGVMTEVTSLDVRDDDRLLATNSPATFAGVRALLIALYGGALVLPRDPRAGLTMMVSTIRDERITMWRTISTLARAIARVDGAHDALASLRSLSLGGERVYGSDVVLLRSVLPPSCEIVVAYGSTEAGVVTRHVVRDVTSGVVAAGYAMPGSTLEIVGPGGTSVSDGAIGELRTAGLATALGYWEAGAVVPGAIGREAHAPASRTFLTGDLFRRRADGLLEFAGRSDRMVKVRGQRVELGDVEAAVRARPGVRDAAVIAVAAGVDTRIVAFVVADEDAPSLARLSDELRSLVPAHMVPTTLRAVDEIPLLPGFKVDVATLERSLTRDVVVDVPGLAPRVDEARDAVAHAWDAAFGRGSFARGETWAEAGGDSMTVLEVAYAIERALGVRMPLDAFASQARGVDLVARVRGADDGASRAASATIVLFPGLRGDEPKLVAFRAMLGSDVRFFVPTYLAWDAIVRDGCDLAAVVDDVVRQIRDGVAERPLAFVGYSFGGSVAHEAAARFVAAGDAVACVALLDASPTSTERIDADAPIASGFARLRRDVARSGVRRSLAHRIGFHLAANISRSERARIVVARHGHRVPVDADVAFAFRHYMTWNVRLALAKALRPAHSPVTTTLFRSRSNRAAAARDLGWGAYASSLSVEDAPGTHDSMVRANDGATLAARVAALVRAHDASRPAEERLAKVEFA